MSFGRCCLHRRAGRRRRVLTRKGKGTSLHQADRNFAQVGSNAGPADSNQGRPGLVPQLEDSTEAQADSNRDHPGQEPELEGSTEAQEDSNRDHPVQEPEPEGSTEVQADSNRDHPGQAPEVSSAAVADSKRGRPDSEPEREAISGVQGGSNHGRPGREPDPEASNPGPVASSDQAAHHGVKDARKRIQNSELFFIWQDGRLHPRTAVHPPKVCERFPSTMGMSVPWRVEQEWRRLT